MAFTLVQSKTGTNSGSPIVVSLTATGAGNMLYVQVTSGRGSSVSVSDGTNTYNAIDTSNHSSQYAANFYAYNIASGITSVSITNNGVISNNFAIIQEWSGVQTSAAPLDVHITNFGTSTALSSGATGTTANATELVIGGGTINTSGSSNALTLGSGYSNLATVTDNNTWTVGVESLITSSTGAQTATFTAAHSFAWECFVATFLPAASTTPTSTFFPFM